MFMRNFLWLGVVMGFVSVGLACLEEKIGQGVMEILKTRGEAAVIITLAEPPSMRTPQIDLPTLRSEITSLQDQVLSTLDPSDFRLKLRYQAVPALAGIATEAGLAKLAANPNVVRIDLDVGGTGSLGGGAR
jgi:hypothetical protein